MDEIDELLTFPDDTLEGRPKPCRTCRRRKVRCSKTQPCSNCQRNEIECVYDETTTTPGRRALGTTGALADRVVELEALISDLQQQLSARGDDSASLMPTEARSSVFAAERTLQRLLRETPEISANLARGPNGRLVSDRGSSRYLINSFWASMYEDIGDLRFILEDEQSNSAPSLWLYGLNEEQDLPSTSMYLPPQKSNYLMQAYIANVDQSIRILHKPTLLKQLNYLWRGILPDFQDFEFQLAAIYWLALLSLSPEDCQTHLGEERAALMAKFRNLVERGLAVLKITTTHKLSSLQTLALYISCLIFEGEILNASSILGYAVRIAQRLGIHRDGTHFNITPFQVDMRRKLWHHIVLLDTWCMENHGLESAIPEGFSDTQLPLNVDDFDWDVSDSSTLGPSSKASFTDMTLALMQYESTALMRSVLKYSVGISGDERVYLDFHTQLRQETWEHIQQTYLTYLDPSDPHQALAQELANMIFERIRLTQLRPVLKCRPRDQAISSNLFTNAYQYCQHVQAAQARFAPSRLDWVVIRGFCWHSLMIMLSTVLTDHAISNTPEARWAVERIAGLFRDRPSFDYLKGSEVLWRPLEKLKVELEAKQRQLAGAGA